MKHLLSQPVLFGVALLLSSTPVAAAGIACADLAKPGTLTDTIVSSASIVPASGQMPAHCKVVATIKPTAGSNIGVEYRLPVSDKWNGKFLGIGGGGFGGVIRDDQFTLGVSRGYAAAQTDIGHKQSDGERWAMTAPGVPNKDTVTDYAWRSVRMMTLVGKEIVQKHYAGGPQRSYWLGCSTGGRQGLVEAQRYPDDYDGMVIGAPVYTSRLQLGGLVRVNEMMSRVGSELPKEIMPVLNKAVLQQCDAQDGLADGYLTDPASCKFDPAKLVCNGGPGQGCLTEAQAAAISTIYKDSPIYEGTLPGTELEFAERYGRLNHAGIGGQMAKYMVFLDPAYDPTKFNPVSDLAAWDAAPVSVEGNAANPEISAFVKRGGKMILWHGLNDPGPSPTSTARYFESVEKFLGAKSRDSVRLFMVPGMYHCRGGPGPNTFDALAVLESWVEKGVAPETIRAENRERGFSRPLCQYPQVARYKGSGDTNDAANFSCVSPNRQQSSAQ